MNDPDSTKGDDRARQMSASANAAGRLATRLDSLKLKFALAESCTGGMASALLTQVSGISRWFCGSAVTYREDTKNKWLNVDPSLIQQHSPVSPQVSAAMAVAILEKTPEADFSVAVTGDLEDLDQAVAPPANTDRPPNANERPDADQRLKPRTETDSREPDSMDPRPLIHIALAERDGQSIRVASSDTVKLQSTTRMARQLEAAEASLIHATSHLDAMYNNQKTS